MSISGKQLKLLLLALLASTAFAESFVNLTATGGGRYECRLDGAVVSTHAQEHKASQQAVNLKLDNPDSTVVCERTKTIVATLTAAGKALVSDADAAIIIGGGNDPGAGSGTYDPDEYDSYVKRYVDLDSASGSADGTSWANAWTMQQAMTNASAGQLVLIRGTNGNTYDFGSDIGGGGGGGYQFEGALQPANSGTAGNYIVFQAEAGSEQAFTLTGEPFVFYLDGNDYMVFRGLKVQSKLLNDSDEGCFTAEATTNIIIEYNELLGRDAGGGNDNHQCLFFHTPGTDTIDIRYNNISGTKTTGYIRSATMRFYDSTNVTIEYNNIFNASDGVDLKGTNSNVTVRYNRFSDIDDNMIVGPHQSTSARLTNANIYQNVFDTNNVDAEWSVVLYFESGEYTDLNFYNNSVYDVHRFAYFAVDSSSGLEVYNNIFETRSSFSPTVYNQSEAAFMADVDYWDYNAYQPNQSSGSITQSTWDASLDLNSLNTAPGYVDAANDDLRLNDSANGIGTGTSNAVGAGIDRAQLLGGLATDPINMGAYITSDQSEQIGAGW